MSIADILLLLLLAFGAYGGYQKGLILEVISLLALVLGVIGGIRLLHWGMDLLGSAYDGFGPLLPLLAFLFIFVLIIVAVSLIGQVLKKVIDWTPLGVVDNIAGAAIGVLKWALGLSILMLITAQLNMDLPARLTKDSVIYPHIAGVAPMVFEWISYLFPAFGQMLTSLQEYLLELVR
jgi:membrane protein required for colicin V production